MDKASVDVVHMYVYVFDSIGESARCVSLENAAYTDLSART